MKYILLVVLVLAITLVGITIGADNDQLVTFNYIIAKSELQLSTLVAILFGLGLLLGWLFTGFFVLRLRLRNARLHRQLKRQNQQIEELTLKLNQAKTSN